MHPFSCFLLPHLPSFCLVCTMCIWVYRRAAPTADPDVRGKLNRMAFGAQFCPDGTCQPQERGQCPALSLLTMTLAGVILHQTCGSLFVFATTTAEQYSCSLLVPSLLACCKHQLEICRRGRQMCPSWNLAVSRDKFVHLKNHLW